MFKKTVDLVERNPVQAFLIGASVIAGVAIARQLADDDRRSALMDQAQRGLHHLSEGGNALAKRARHVRHSQVVPDADELRARLPDIQLPNSVLSSLGVREKTLAVFMATLLAKSVTGYFRWRTEQRALENGALAQKKHSPTSDSLDELTVAELRSAAAEREIEGRSSMNKSELIDALASGD